MTRRGRACLDLDPDAILEREEAIISGGSPASGRSYVTATREFPGEAGTGTPRARLDLDPSLGRSAGAVADEPGSGPAGDVGVVRDSRYLTAMTLQDGEAQIVTDALAAALTKDPRRPHNVDHRDLLSGRHVRHRQVPERCVGSLLTTSMNASVTGRASATV